VGRYEAIVEAFAPQWPSVGYPTGGWSGDQNPWDASDFMSYCMNAIGSDHTAAGTEALERLSVSIGHTSYSQQVKHVAYVQRRNRRDQEYTPPTIDAVTKILANAGPATVDDLKAVILDHLSDLQQYVRNADTGGWEAFWENGRPKVENVCRDRLLDLLRPRLSSGIELFPELPMPDQKRVDIYATILGQGLPTEIKGQWHTEVWNASNTQLNEKYARDWRTSGRGIYLVLWFGHVAGKNLPGRPDAKPLPSSPSELQILLFEGLGEGERSRIDVVVFDVSRPQRKATRPSAQGLTSPSIPDRRQMLVDAEHHQDELRGDARGQNTDQHSGEAGDCREGAGDRVERERAERGHQPREARQDHDHDHQPIEQLDDGRRDETLPLEQVADIEHDLLRRRVVPSGAPRLHAAYALSMQRCGASPACALTPASSAV